MDDSEDMKGACVRIGTLTCFWDHLALNVLAIVSVEESSETTLAQSTGYSTAAPQHLGRNQINAKTTACSFHYPNYLIQ